MIPLASPPVRLHSTDMDDVRAVLQEILESAPGSIRALAREAGVNETLLRKIRDGERRLTRDTRDAVAAALRRWEERCGGLAEDLESAELEGGDTDG